MSNAGIYKITNVVNNKIYIGSAKNFTRRFANHRDFLKRKVHPNIHLQRASALYGASVFMFEILEYVTTDKLLEREQFYIDTLKPDYNILKIAGSRLGMKHSKETKEKIGKSNTPERNLKRSLTQTGVPKSEDHKYKIGIGNSNVKRWPCADGHKCKCSNCKNTRNLLRKNYPSYHWGKYVK